MARIRTIKPEFPHSESMGNVSRDARLTFIMLWTLADDSGRLRGNSRMLASVLFPYDDDAPSKIDSWLTELERESCITLYSVGGTSYCQIRKWLSHQKIDKPTASKIPSPPEESRGFANVREESSLDQGSKEGNGKEGNGAKDHGHAALDREESETKTACIVSDALPDDPVAASFNSTVGVFLDRWQTLPEGVRGVVRVAAIGASGVDILAFVSPKDRSALTSFLPQKFKQAMQACDAIEKGAIEWDRSAMTLRQFPDAIDSLVAGACKAFSQTRKRTKTDDIKESLKSLYDELDDFASTQSQQKRLA